MSVYLIPILRNLVVFQVLVIGSVLTTRAGAFCLAIEGAYVAGAAASALAIVNGGTSGLWGLVAGVGAATVLGVSYAALVYALSVEEIVAGVAANLLVVGLASSGFYWLAGAKSVTFSVAGADAGLWIGGGVVVACAVVLRKTIIGVWLDGVGVGPSVAVAADLRVSRIRAVASVLGCTVAGLAGASVTLAGQGFALGQTKEGIGYLAIGVALAARGRVGVALAVGVVVAVLRTWTLVPPDAIVRVVSQDVVELAMYGTILAAFVGLRDRRPGQSH